MAMNWVEQIEETEDTQAGRYLTFASGKDTFAIEIRHVTEIVGMQPVTSLPEAPEYVKGIINLRGQIITVTDLNIRFKKKPEPYDDKTCIIIIDTGEESLGLIVPRVADVVNIEDEYVEAPPDKGLGVKSKYLKGIGKIGNEIKLILDTQKLFS